MATSTYLTSYQAPSNASSHTFSATLGSTFTGKISVTVSVENATDVTGVTFDGASMTLDRSHDNGSTLKIRTYYLDLSGKASGTYNVVVSCGGSISIIASAFALTDVATGASEAFGTSNASPGTATLTATASAALIAVTVNSSGTATHTFSGDVTERDDRVISGGFAAAVADASNVSAGSRSATATYSAGTGALLLLSYAHSGGGSPSNAPRSMYYHLQGLR